MKRRRLELPRHNCHYPLKVARLPIPPPLQKKQTLMCPEQDSNLHVSQHSHLKRARLPFRHLGMFVTYQSGKRGSNSRPRPWQGRALPTELFPQILSINFSSFILSNAVAKVRYFFKSPNFSTIFFDFILKKINQTRNDRVF